MLDRLRIMARGRRGLTLLAALALLAVASLATSFSGASYTTTTTNGNDTFSAGSLVMSEPAPGAVVLSADKLRPGQSASGTVMLSAGEDPGAAVGFSVADAGVTDVPGAPALSDALTLTLADVTDAAHPRAIWSGPMRSLGTQQLAHVPVGGTLVLRVTLAFPLAAARPELQGAQSSMRLRFVEESL